MLAATSSRAGEVEFFVETRLGGDSNVFRRVDGSEPSPASGGTWEIAPRISVREGGDDLEYDIRYQPTYERFFGVEGDVDDGNISGLDHNAFGNVVWRMSPATTLSAEGTFFRRRRLRLEFIDVPLSSVDVIDANDSTYVQRSIGSATLSRSLDPLTSVSATYAYDGFDVNQSSVTDSEAHTVSLGINRALSAKTQVGVSLNGRFRSSRASVAPGGSGLTEFRSETRTIDGAFSVAHSFTERLRLSVAVGPSFLDTRDERSTGEVSYSNNQSVFARVSGDYGWRHGDLRVAYTRSEAGGGGTGATSIVDDVSVGIAHRFDRRWWAFVRTSWLHRSSISSDAFFGLDTRIDRIGVSGSIRYEITPRLSILGRIGYSTQDVDEFRPSVAVVVPPGVVTVLPGVDQSRTTEAVQGFVGLRYTFEPFVF